MGTTIDTISFLTDYGLADEFVGVCKAVIRQLAPHAHVLDITHDIAPHNVRAGSLALTNSTFTNNTASGGSAVTADRAGQGKGGAVFILAPASVNGCGTFNGNSATNAAGSATDTNDFYGPSSLTCDITPPTITASSSAMKTMPTTTSQRSGTVARSVKSSPPHSA